MEGLIELFVFLVLLMLIGFVKFTEFFVQENNKSTSILSEEFRTMHFFIFNKVTSSSQLILAILTLVLPGVAYANAGLPMLFLAMPAFLISLLPIIAIETFYISKGLNITIGQSLKVVSISNAVSTVVGIPLTWFLLVLIQMLTGGGGAYGLDSFMGKVLAVTWQAPWLIPYEKDLNWMIPLAGLVLLVPFFFASWWSEYLVSKKMLKSIPSASIKYKVRNANLITYLMLASWPIGFWILNSVIK
jgi:hypothetical protein